VARVRVVLCVLVVALAAAGASASSSAARPKTLAAYCSSSGDICFGILNRSGAVYLDLSAFARYFERYRVCVRPPGGAARSCRTFPLRPRGRVWGSSARYGRWFPVGAPGVYRVTWSLGSDPLGPTLRFRLPLAR